MYIRDIMTKTPATVRRTTPAAKVVESMSVKHINSLYVVEDGQMLGVITQSQILRHIFPSYQEFYNDLVHSIDFEEIGKRSSDLSSLTAADLMEPVSVTVTPDMPVMKVAAWMLIRDISCVPVIDGQGVFIGVVSRGDIFYHTFHPDSVGMRGITQ